MTDVGISAGMLLKQIGTPREIAAFFELIGRYTPKSAGRSLVLVDEYADPDLGLDEVQKAAGKEFVDRMRDFDKIGGPELPWQEVIDHPGWIKVREAAARFLALLRPTT